MGKVRFYKNTSDNRCLAKTLTQLKEYADVKFKDNSSIIEPELILSTDTDVFGANYCWIEAFSNEEFNRFYFITNVEVSQQHIIVRCKLDVLYTYQSQIENMYGYIRRSSVMRNRYIQDNQKTQQANYMPEYRYYFKGSDVSNYVLKEAGTTDGWVLWVSGAYASSPFPPDNNGGE